MGTGSEIRLKELLEQLGMTHRRLADEIHIDPAMISRWCKRGFGKRRVSHNVMLVGEYVAAVHMTPENHSWLCSRLGLPETAMPTAQQVALWLVPELASELQERKNLSQLPKESLRPELVGSFYQAIEETRQADTHQSDFSAAVGASAFTSLLRNEAQECPDGTLAQVFLTSEGMTCVLEQDFLYCLRTLSNERGIRWKLLVQCGSDSASTGKLVSAVLPLIVQGALEMDVMHGVPATLTAQMQIILPGKSALLVTEIMRGKHEVLTSVTRESKALEDMSKAFEESLLLARPMLKIYDDSFARNIVETFFAEYGVAGHLDVIKSGMNPMYYTPEQYGVILRKLGHTGEQYDWRYQEFERFKAGMDQILETSRSREILCLPKLREIVSTGVCRMPAMYFFSPGIWKLDAEDCLALLDGYIHYLEAFPQFQVILLEDEALFMPNSCWHIKKDRHIMIHSWDIDNPLMVYSDEMLLIDEFQNHFDGLWKRVSPGMTRRAIMEQLKALRQEYAARWKISTALP